MTVTDLAWHLGTLPGHVLRPLAAVIRGRRQNPTGVRAAQIIQALGR